MILSDLNQALRVSGEYFPKGSVDSDLLNAFIQIALNDGELVIQDIPKKIGKLVDNPTRVVGALSDGYRGGNGKWHAGAFLVVAVEDSRDRRFKRIYLTSRGKELVARLRDI